MRGRNHCDGHSNGDSSSHNAANLRHPSSADHVAAATGSCVKWESLDQVILLHALCNSR
jgi:hypothetical protein